MRPSRARRVGGRGQAGVGRAWQFVEREDERADDGMVEALVAVVVESHVVGGPAASELVAEGGELAEEVGQVPISGVSAGFDAQWSSQLNGRVAATDCWDQRAAGARSALTIASGVRPCAVGRPIGVGASALNMSCRSCMAIEPSPTADATRLTEPRLTSPTANTPGALVSTA